MKTLVVDAYDSFVYILVEYLKQLDMNPIVYRINEISIDLIEKVSPDMILLGPGPGHPKDAGYTEIIHRFKGQIPILGVCLGHQAIGLAFDCKISKACNLRHGKKSLITNDQQGIFQHFDSPCLVTRYHSLIIDKKDFNNDELIITSNSMDDHYIMGVRHKKYSIEGIQFHPESIGTINGLEMLQNFKKRYVE